MSYCGADISVVIPSYNSMKSIGKCLAALAGQTQPAREIIVVDSSEDKTADYLRNQHPEVKLLVKEARIFPGPGRNMGARMASGKILAFIDSDCIPVPNWLEQIAQRHTEGNAVVGGSIDVGDPQNPYAWAGHLMEFREYIPRGKARYMGHIPSCNISYNREVFLETGGYPESYYPQEDLLLNYMLNLEGVKILFDPQIAIRHYCRDSLREYTSHQHRIGRVTCSVLKKLSLDGSFIARDRWRSRFFSPVLGLLKFIRTSAVALREYPLEMVHNPLIIPLILVGATWWARGFAAGGDRGLSGIKGWEDPYEPIFFRIDRSIS